MFALPPLSTKKRTISERPPRLSQCPCFCPLLGEERTFVSKIGMSALGHKMG
jgi:hypothetical protein